MKIIKFVEFIKENKDKSIGEWIESVCKNDEYLLTLVSHYTQDVDPSVRLANAVDLLDDFYKEELYKKIKDHLHDIQSDKEVDVIASVDSSDILENTQAGKNVFKSFLKLITALGLKEHSPDWNKTPEDFLIYFLFENVDVEKFKSVSMRFKSIELFIDSMDYTSNICELYFGIKTDMTFEYGIRSVDVVIPVGLFKINRSNFNWLMLLDSVSAAPLKRQLIDLDINKILMFSKIKKTMQEFSPGYSQKKSIPQIQGDVITFGYYGLGKWDSGKLDSTEFENIKNKFKNWLSKFKWSEKILVSVTNNSFWVYFNFKLKK